MQKLRNTLLGAVSVLGLATLTAAAQTTTARVSGTITDASGAGVGHATVMLHNEATNTDRTTTAGDNGEFSVMSLPPAVYDLKATAPGFAVFELRKLTLQVGQEFVWTPALGAEGATASVTVTGDEVSLIDTSSARIGANVPSREIEQLPINGRQISQLYLLTPGATNSGTGTFDNIHFSGRAVEQNIIRLDGIEATSIIDTSPGNLNGELTSTFRLQQSLEAVQEFRIDSSSYPAEMGTGTGGQISFITKSGTNKVHGSLFEYVRNDFFDARNYFNRVNTAGNNPKFRLNQFGGSVGGPLVKDKLFFFAAYEGLRQVYAAPYTQATLSNCSRAIVAASANGAAIAPLLAAYPTEPGNAQTECANITNGVAAPIRSVTVTTNGQNRIQEDFGDIRFDYHFNDRFQLYARYNRDQGVSSQVQDASLSRFGQVEVPQNGVIALNQVLSPRIFNETKFGFNGIKMRVQGIAGASPNADLSRSRIAIAGLTNVGSLISLSSSFNGVGAPYTGQSYSYIDNFSFTTGKHSLKFGAEIRPLGLYNDQIGGQTYTYNSITDFTGDTAVAGYTPANTLTSNRPAMIQFYGNLSDTSPFTGLSGNAYVKQAYYIFYGQDEWHPTSNLTISAGLRWEYYSPLHERRNKDVVFSISQGTIFPGFTGDWYRSSTKNFGPRLGVTYAPNLFALKTVVRVGGGIFYGPGQTEDQIQPEANDRVSKTFAASTGKVYPINPATDVYAGYNINDPNLGYQPRAYADNYVIPERVGTYTASIEQELPAKFQLMVGYVGSVGRNLFLRSITNLITGVATNPNTGAATVTRQFGGRFAEIDYKTSHGHDSYNSFQSTLQRRFNSGVSFGLQYTFAKELGTSSGSNEATTAQNPYDFSTEFGRGTFDIRHTMNATVLYDLPFGHGRRYSFGPVADSLVGGWQLGGIVNLRSGVPLDVLVTRPDVAYVGNAGYTFSGQVYSAPVCVTTGTNTVATCSATTTAATTAVVNVPGGGNTRNVRRPNVVSGVSRYLGSRNQFINPAAFSLPAPGTFGNARRNDTSGPGLSQLDLTLQKNFAVFERYQFEFKADAYNILNHPNFGNPGNIRLAQGLPAAPGANSIQPGTAYPTGVNGIAGASFGVLSSTVGNQVGIGTNRQMQLSLRLKF